MTDNERNTRTLVVSFVIAVMVMVPLRMVEYGQTRTAQVLGAKSVRMRCLTPLEADRMRSGLLTRVKDQALTSSELNQIKAQLVKIKGSVCR